jgi:hypothetical protein
MRDELCIVYNAIDWNPVSNQEKALHNLATEWADQNIIVCDLQHQTSVRAVWPAIEAAKKGHFCVNAKCVDKPRPHLIVFASELPKTCAMCCQIIIHII